MNFTSIVAEVVRISKRPDKLFDAQREVNMAVQFFATDSLFDRDIAELLIPISASEFTQDIAFADLPRFRKFQYIRRSGTTDFLTALDKNLLFTKNCDRADKYYIIGSGIRISMTATASNLDVGFWQYPPTLTNASPEYWQLDGNWPAVLDRALAKIFTNIGDDASAARHERYAVTAYLAFRASIQNQS